MQRASAAEDQVLDLKGQLADAALALDDVALRAQSLEGHCAGLEAENNQLRCGLGNCYG